jgi:hypothetical protein
VKYIGIVGSRRRDTPADLRKTKRAFQRIYEPGDRIVSGGCKQGGDRFAEIIAAELGVKPIIYYPDKSQLDPRLLALNPRVAYAKINYARNALVAARADELIACVASDRKGGTEDTIKRFEKRTGKAAILC